MSRKEELLGLLGAAGGGGAAAALDVKFPTTTLMKLPPSALLGTVMSLGGLAAINKSPTAAKYALDVAKGAIGFSTGNAVVNQMLKLKPTQQQTPAAKSAGTSGSVGGLRSAHQPVSQADLNASFVRARAQVPRAA